MWLAQASGGVDASLPQWFQAAGVVSILTLGLISFIRGWLVSGSFHRQQIEDLDKRIEMLERDLREQTQFMRDQAVPLLTRNVDVLAKVLEEQTYERKRAKES